MEFESINWRDNNFSNEWIITHFAFPLEHISHELGANWGWIEGELGWVQKYPENVRIMSGKYPGNVRKISEIMSGKYPENNIRKISGIITWKYPGNVRNKFMKNIIAWIIYEIIYILKRDKGFILDPYFNQCWSIRKPKGVEIKDWTCLWNLYSWVINHLNFAITWVFC